MRKTEIVYNIPGGLYGNDPGSFTNDANIGNVVVDAKDTMNAISWLKRRAKIDAVMPARSRENEILITYTMK